jgi:hypothetical protein
VADTFPASLTCTWTCVGAGGGTCTASGSGNINGTVNLPSGASVTYTASCTISNAATGTLSNTATVTAPGGVTDPTPGNNSATDTDTLTAAPGASVSGTKTAAGTFTVGGTITATILPSAAGTTVSNQGSIAFDADGNGTNESTAQTDDPGVAGTANPTSIQVAVVSVVGIPALSPIGLLLLALSLAGLAFAALRRRKSA